MTAFLFIPPSGPGLARRVDFANIASLFAEADEPPARLRPTGFAMRVFAAFMIMVFAVGDMVLVARPYALTHTLPPQSAPAARAATSL